jgi:molybdopterin-dependent oxidoreductase alpha subunit
LPELKISGRYNALMNYSEQLFLLSVDPVTGRLFPISDQVLNLTLAGALLFDASFKGIINDDWAQLTVLKTAETGNAALDEAIRCLLIIEGPIPLDKAIELVAAHGTTLRRMVWDSLLAGGLLVKRKQSIVVSSGKEELFSPDLPLVVGIHKKIRDAILQDEIPDIQIPALVSLMVACRLTKYVLKPDEAVRFENRLNWLSRMESLGREIIISVYALESADLEKDAAALIGLKHDQPRTHAGGMEAVLNALTFLYKETGINRGRKIMGNFNQVGGFECPSCSWPNPDKHRSHFEFCENGAKNVSAEATTRTIAADFFEKWSVHDLLLTPGFWLEQQGRLTEPMMLDENSTHYRPISWDDAFQLIAKELKALNHPDEAVFYVSGRSSNEASFVFQLLARALGTNNLPDCANLCHESSGKALEMSLGCAKGGILLDDFSKADAIFIFGHNPGSNHPRMLSALQAAVRKGCKIVAVNPMPEASLMGFANPQEATAYFGKQTRLAHLYIQPKINGDMALVRGMAKAVFEAEKRNGGILDRDFIKTCTNGFDKYRQRVMNASWDELVSASDVEKDQIIEAAEIYIHSNSSIASWCLGIAHHRNSIETIGEIINLMLLKGNIGRPGAGIFPVRGHSNVQGVRSSGARDDMPVSFLEALEKRFSIKVPRKPGMGTIPAIRSMAEGKTKILVSLGGNLASAAPDTAYVEKALRQCNLTVMISTKLNRSHLVTGARALILPCLARTDEDLSNGTKQFSTFEDTMGKISVSQGCLPPFSPNQRSEVEIITGIAAATFNDKQIEWQRFAKDYQHIRSTMAEVLPAFNGIQKLKPKSKGIYFDNPLRKRVFNTDDGKAQFCDYPLETVVSEPGELLLMTVRSHDQFNTSIFGLNDRYRGINNERRVLFMNVEDMKERSIAPEQIIEIASYYDNQERKLEGYYAIPYPIKQGCVAAYFPETNILISINNTNPACETPAYKSVRVQVRQASL